VFAVCLGCFVSCEMGDECEVKDPLLLGTCQEGSRWFSCKDMCLNSLHAAS
jgi:hypothetical protein